MEVPTLGTIPLTCGELPCAGAAFELAQPARRSDTTKVGQWTIEVEARKSVVVARCSEGDNYESAFKHGLEHAQKGLDLLSLKSPNSLLIKKYEDQHITWWTEPADTTTLRITSIAQLNVEIGAARAVVRDSAGNVVPNQPVAELEWHESFRYYRLSQSTDDLFDAFRNAYLALESILSTITPQRLRPSGRPDEGEGEWFRRALTEANSLVTLASHVPNGTPDPVGYLYNRLYIDTRSAMSHAKSGRRVLLPQNDTERNEITRSLETLIQLYLRLAEAKLGARKLGGGIFAAGFRLMFARIFDDIEVYASDDSSPFNEADESPNPHGGILLPLQPASVTELDIPYLATRLWTSPVAALRELPCIRRVIAAQNGAPYMGDALEADLTLGHIDQFEVQLGGRGVNASQPRSRYSF
jgi:hypothetical protein